MHHLPTFRSLNQPSNGQPKSLQLFQLINIRTSCNDLSRMLVALCSISSQAFVSYCSCKILVCTCPHLHRIQSHSWWKGSACGLQRSPEVRVHLPLDFHFILDPFPPGKKKNKPSARSKVSQMFCFWVWMKPLSTLPWCFISCQVATCKRAKGLRL